MKQPSAKRNPLFFLSNKSAEVKKVGSDGRQGEEKEGGLMGD